MGWSVVLLAPVWALGALAFYFRDYGNLTAKIARVGLCVSILASVTFAVIQEFPSAIPTPALQASAAFGKDWLLGGAVTAVIWFFNRAMIGIPISQRLDGWVRWLSNHTFSLYLFHVPLMEFSIATGLFNSHSVWQNALETVTILAVILGLSELTGMRRKPLQKMLLSRL